MSTTLTDDTKAAKLLVLAMSLLSLRVPNSSATLLFQTQLITTQRYLTERTIQTKMTAYAVLLNWMSIYQVIKRNKFLAYEQKFDIIKCHKALLCRQINY